MLETYARQVIHGEALHAGGVDKMLRRPGEVDTTGLGPKPLQAPFAGVGKAAIARPPLTADNVILLMRTIDARR